MDAPKQARVLFLCTGNSCRSQMAEGWARHLLENQVDVHSAGVAPHGVDPRAVKAMAEAGVDISGQRSKHVDELAHLAFDLVITLCDDAQQSCPVFPATVRVIHHGLEDPPRLAAGARNEQEAMAHYRRVRDEIRALIEALPDLVGDDP
jgi:arsenate reductase